MILPVAGIVFATLFLISQYNSSSKKLNFDEAPEPLGYASIGNLPPQIPLIEKPSQETEYTLEIATCEDKHCIAKTLHTLRKKGVDAFYTPFRVDQAIIYRIRRGIFSSRRLAERAKFSLHKQFKIRAKVAEL